MNQQIRRINIYGSVGVGKSTTTAWLFAQLKIAGYNIQFVEEHVKKWAYQGRPILSFDQMYLSVYQVKSEDELLRSGVNHIITDSPCMISYFFTKRNNLEYAPIIVELSRLVEKKYPSINVYLYRDVEYQPIGRYESEDEAKKLDIEMLDFLKKEYPDLIIISPRNKELLLEKLDNALSRSMSNTSE